MEKALEAKPLDALPRSACLFLQKGVDNSTESSVIGEIQQRGLIGPYSTLTYETDALDLSFIDMKKSYFEARVKAYRVDKEPLGTADFTVTNNLFHSLFSDIIVSINGTQISSSSGKYPYQSMMYTLMDTKQSTETYRSLALYKQETEGRLHERRTRVLVVPIDSEMEENEDIIRRSKRSTNEDILRRMRRSAAQPSTSPNQSGKSSSTTGSSTSTDPATNAQEPTDLVKTIGATNPSMFWRAEHLAGGNEISLFAKLDMDIFHIETYLLNGASLKIVFKQSSPEFRILQPDDAPAVNVALCDLIFHPFYLRLSPELVLATEDLLEKKRTVIMPYTANSVDSYTIAPGTYLRYFFIARYTRRNLLRCGTTVKVNTLGLKFDLAAKVKTLGFNASLSIVGKRSFRIVDAFNGMQPLSILCCMVDSEAALGSRALNPFDLHHFNLSSLEVRSNQQLLYTVKMDWENDDFQAAYYDLFKNNFGNIAKQSPYITQSMFKNGFFMISVELSEPIRLYQHSPVWTKMTPGSVTISGTFSQPLHRSVDFIFMGMTYDSILITSKRAVFLASSRFRENKSALV